MYVFSAILDDQAEKEMYKDRFNPFGLDLLGVDFFKMKKCTYICACVSLCGIVNISAIFSEARKGCWMSWSWNYRQLCRCGG